MGTKASHLPNGIVLVIAYLCILSTSSFFGGLTILTTVFPAAVDMQLGVGMMLVMGIAPIILGGFFAWSAWYIWRLNPHGRILAIILACLMALVGLFGSMMFLDEWAEGFNSLSLTFATLLLVSSIAVVLYLMKAPILKQGTN